MVFPASAGPVLPRRARPGLLLLLLLIVLAITRWSLAPRYLYYFDSINFALALDHFDPWNHQPQPPGYPLFVGALRVVHLAFPDPQHVLVVTGLLIAMAALVLSWRLASDMFDPAAGVLAAALLLFNPPFWLSGVTNQVRLCLALCSAGTALLAWRAVKRPGQTVWLLLAFGALGVAAGFRPADCILLVPLLLWAWYRTGAGIARLALALGCMLGASLPWMAVTSWVVGGPSRWLYLMWTYGRDQFRGSSALFGAPAVSAWEMAAKATVWTGLGLIAWVWALPFLRARLDEPVAKERLAFLAAWLVPPFAFSAAVHIGDPDQALTTIVGLCVAGGAVLSAVLRRFDIRRTAALAASVAAVNALLFFVPAGRLASASTWEVVRSTDERLRTTFDAIESARGEGSVAIVHYGAEVTWRHLFYYFPSDYLLYLPQDEGELAMSFSGRKLVKAGSDATQLPRARRMVLVAPHLNANWMTEHGWQVRGPVFWRDLYGNEHLQVGKWSLQSEVKDY